MKGHFGISVSSTAILQISFIRYRTEEVTASPAKTSLKVILRENSEQLEEVVVVGYGVQKKANLTGSVASVNFKDVNTMPVANTTNMLQGRLPGVVLTNNGAQAGKDTPEIRIRGVGTLSGNNDPMVLIDGVERLWDEGLVVVAAAGDIDNVSVLKDAASASIYGVRAANGVILITTKRGMESKPAISYSGSIALQEATVLPDYVGSYDWAKMYNDAQGTDFYTPEMLQKIQDGSDPDHFANTDWARELFHTAAMHQHHLSVSGGGKDTHYMISTSYFNQSGILKETGYERFNFRSNSQEELEKLRDRIFAAIDEACKEETDRWGMDTITYEVKHICDVNAGHQDSHASIVEGAMAAAEFLGCAEPKLGNGGSTNCNRALEAGLPAVCLGGGCDYDCQCHTLDEQFKVEDAFKGCQQTLLMTLLCAGTEMTESII